MRMYLGRVPIAAVYLWTALGTALHAGEGPVGADCNANGVPDPLELSPPLFLRAPLALGTIEIPEEIAVADFDADGVLDVAAETVAGTVVLRGLGGGAFAGPLMLPGTTQATKVRAGDVSGDGRADLVVVFLRHLSVFISAADGGFLPSIDTETSAECSDLVVIDLDGDDLDDVVSVHDSTAVFRRSLGDGTLEEVASEGVGALIAIGDWDRDGDLDLAALDARDPLLRVFHRETGDLVLEAEKSTFHSPRSLTAADTNGDSLPDLVLGHGEPLVSVFLGNEAGTFEEPSEIPTPTRRNPRVATADIDGDGRIDIVASNSVQSRAVILYGDGTGRFEHIEEFATSESTTHVLPADVTGDGKVDLLAAQYRLRHLSLLVGTDDGPAYSPRSHLGGIGAVVAVGDLNGDGEPEIVSANRNRDEVTIYSNRLGAVLETLGSFATRPEPESVVIVDANEDGTADIVIASDADRRIVIHPRVGGGEFGPLQVLEDGGDWPRDLLVADMDADGHADLVSANVSSPQLSVRYADGSGGFLPPLTSSASNGAACVAVADLNGDDRLDLITQRSWVPAVAPREFGVEVPLDVLHDPRTSAVLDLSGDGVMDLAFGNRDGSVSVMLGDGDGAFSTEQTIPLGATEITRLVAADFDLDGLGDLAVIDTGEDGDGSVHVLRGASLEVPAVRLVAGSRSLSGAAGDVDADGRPDLLVADGGDVVVVLNDTSRPLEADCNRNQVPDSCEIAADPSLDRDTNGELDACQDDCNGNGTPDAYEIAEGLTPDVNLNGVPDSCETDCNGNGTDDRLEILRGEARDCDGNGIPDTCDIASGESPDCNGNGVPDGCDLPRGPELLGVVSTDGGEDLEGMASGDFDEDGALDLAVASSTTGSPSVRILLGRGNGSFVPAAPIPVARAYGVAAGLIDGDTHDDLAVRSSGTVEEITVHLGRGDGSFAPVGQALAVESPSAIALLDFDGSGTTDLAVASIRGTAIRLFRGDGDGRFTFLEDLPLPVEPSSITVARLNGDVMPDLVAVSFRGRAVAVLLSSDDSVYEPAVLYDTPALEPRSVAALDVDGDGDDDVVAGGAAPQDWPPLHLFSGDGTGTLAPRAGFYLESHGGASELHVTDLDGDSEDDLVALGNDGTFSVLLGRSNATTLPSFAAGTGPDGMWLDDFDGDGRIDVALADDTRVHVVRGFGGERFASPRLHAILAQIQDLAVHDFDQDGHTDALMLTDGSLVMLRGSADGALNEYRRIGSTVGALKAIATGEIDNDGRPDLVVVSRTGPILACLGRSDLRFAVSQVGSVRIAQAVELADLSGDGALDIIIGTQGEGIHVLLGDGEGDFDAPSTYPGVSDVADIAAGDLDGDGEIDVACTVNEGPRPVALFRGLGGGVLEPPLHLELASPANAVAFADLDRDGRLELVVGTDAGVSVLRGSDELASQASYPTGGTSSWLNVVDFNRDGHPDVLSMGHSSGDVSLLMGVGDGSFRPRLRFLTGRQGKSVHVADLNEDGVSDVLSLALHTDDLSVYLSADYPHASVDRDGNGVPDDCEGGWQVPGDCDQDGALNLTDAVCTLGVLFLGTPARLPCGTGTFDDPAGIALLDVQGSGRIDLTDAIGLLNYLFLGGPPHPYTDPSDPARCTPILGCASSPACEAR